MPADRLVVNVDGGARGNPGPAAIAAVLQDTDGELLEERSELIGEATNNVAEYRALLLGIERAAARGAEQLDLVGDSELVVRQVKGQYKVKDATLRELHRQVLLALQGFEEWTIRARRPRRERGGRPARQRGPRRGLGVRVESAARLAFGDVRARQRGSDRIRQRFAFPR